MIRRAKIKDIDRILSLLRQVLEVHASKRPDIFKPGTTKYTNEELKNLIKDDEKPIFVYTDDKDTVLGYAFCIIEEVKNSNNLQNMKSLYIDDICVDENYRRMHIASSLFYFAKDYAKSINAYRITLNIWELNSSAKLFYESVGMIPLKTTMEEIL